MDIQLVVSLIVSLVVIIFVLSPFFMGKGGKLASAAAINDPEKLKGLKQAILKRYLQEEHAAKEGDLSEAQWHNRSKLLKNRYLDVSKRLDFLTGGHE